MYNQDASATLGVAMTAKVPPKPSTCPEGGYTKAGLFVSAWRGKCPFKLHQGSFPIPELTGNKHRGMGLA